MSRTFLRLVIPEPNGSNKPPPCTREDPELFFPISEHLDYLPQIRQAKAVCRRCPVIATCLEFALDTGDEHAILGGTTPSERTTIRRKRHERSMRRAA